MSVRDLFFFDLFCFVSLVVRFSHWRQQAGNASIFFASASIVFFLRAMLHRVVQARRNHNKDGDPRRATSWSIVLCGLSRGTCNSSFCWCSKVSSSGSLLARLPRDIQGTTIPHFDGTAKMISNHLCKTYLSPISFCKLCSDTVEAWRLNILCFCIWCKLLFDQRQNNDASSARRN